MRISTSMYTWIVLWVCLVRISVPCILADSFCENFESLLEFPSGDWGYHTLHYPDLIPGIDTVNGNPDHCYVPGGAGNGRNTEIYHTGLLADYSGGLIMECDFFISNASSHYTDLLIGLPRIPIENGVNMLYSVFMQLNSNAGTRNVQCYIDSDRPEHTETYTLSGGFVTGQWYRAGIHIRPDQFVEFYLDSDLIHTSSVTVDPDYNFAPPVLHGFNANPVYADNFCVGPYIPVEATPTPTQTPFHTATPIPTEPPTPQNQYILEFSGGKDDMIVIDDQEALRFSGGSFTIEFWMHTRSITDCSLVYKWGEGPTSADDEYLVQMASNGGINFSLHGVGNWFQSTQHLLTDTWYHIACVYDSGSQLGTIYFNGENAGSATLNPMNYATSVPLRFGGQTVSPYGFDGYLDEIRISDTARYFASFEPPCRHACDAYTRGLWHCDEGTGGLLEDGSWNDNHGEILGNTVFVPDPGYCGETPMPTPEPTATPTPVIPTASPTEPSPVPTSTSTPVSTSTPSPTLTPVQTETPVPDPTGTPDPTCTPSPVPTDTPVPSPTDTPYPIPTDTPATEPTATPSQVATQTPTSAPPTHTRTPVPTVTQTPANTPTPSYPLNVTLELPRSHYYANDEFYLFCHLSLTGDHPVSGRLFVLLEIMGGYYYFPSWKRFEWWDLLEENKDEWSVAMTVLEDTTEIILDAFKMPFFPFRTTGCVFSSTLTDMTVSSLLSNVSIVEWGFGGERP